MISFPDDHPRFGRWCPPFGGAAARDGSSELGPWRVRASVYSHFIASGRPPSVAQLAQASNAAENEVREALSILAWNDQVVLQPNGELLAAPPFSAVPTPFEVEFGATSPAWGFGLCASLGIAAIVDREARVTTHCGHCFRGMEIEIDDGACNGPDETVVQFVVPAGQALDDVVYACSTELPFCSAAHAAAWRARYGQPEGQLLPLQQAWRLAAVWYAEDRRSPDWRSRTALEKNEVFARLGLPAPFWRVTPPYARLGRGWPKGHAFFRVFADEAGAGGTPALVTDAVDGFAEAEVARIAGYWGGESTWVYRESELPRLRFFLPTGEIAASTHGTLAAAAALADGGPGRRLRFAAGGREIRVAVRKDPDLFAEVSADREPMEAVGAAAQQVALSALGLGSAALGGWPVLLAGSSRRTVLLPLSSAATLHAILTSKARVRRACERLGGNGLYPFAVTGPRVVEARHFPADSNLDEDPATASAALALASAADAMAYDLPSSRTSPLRIRQGTALGEPSELFIHEDEGGRLTLGGRVIAVHPG